jgi:hypothetical protein
MAATYEPISTQTLGAAAGTITFSSIPATYTDLRFVLTGTCGTSGNIPKMTFNGITTTTYSRTDVWGVGSGAGGSTTGGTQTGILLGVGSQWWSTTPSVNQLDVFSYAGSTNKTVLYSLNSDNNGSGQVDYGVGLWRSTAAITSVTFTMPTNFQIGTTATLYGIKAA